MGMKFILQEIWQDLDVMPSTLLLMNVSLEKKPKSLNWEQAASVPLCALTAWEGIVDGMGITVPSENRDNAKKSLLVIGGAGGVGSMVIQIAKKVLKIGTVIATASREETKAWCKKMGADHVINHNNLKDDLTKIGHPSTNYVYVCVDMNTVYDNALEVTKPHGKLLGITGWDGVDPSKAFYKSVTLVTEFMFARPMHDEEPEKQAWVLNHVGELLDKGVLVHTLNSVFELSKLADAHKLQDSGKAIGKIGLVVKF